MPKVYFQIFNIYFQIFNIYFQIFNIYFQILNIYLPIAAGMTIRHTIKSRIASPTIAT